MNLRKVAKASLLYVLLPIFVTVVAGYIVERIKGTPPDQIAAAMWWPVGAALGGTAAWLTATARSTHFDMLVIIGAIVWLALALRRLWRTVWRIDSTAIRGPMGKLAEDITRLQGFDRKMAAGTAEDDPKVTEGFEPSRLQILAAKVLLDIYPRRLQLPFLATSMQREASTFSPIATQGEIARHMEDMQQKGAATIDDPDSQVAYYGLTRHGRNFMLEWISRPSRDAQEADPHRSPLRGLDDPQDE